VRVEVQTPKKDASLIRALAETRRGAAEQAEALRSRPAKALMHPEVKTAFDIFGSEPPDEAFTGAFDQPGRGAPAQAAPLSPADSRVGERGLMTFSLAHCVEVSPVGIGPLLRF
jgi:hypothetical protein